LDLVAGTSETSSRRGSRDEVAFYQAEASMLNRENQMLRQRIRELGSSAVFPPSIISAKSRHLFISYVRSELKIQTLTKKKNDVLVS
jgi:hypothetical protein